jgi:cytochrome c peroxidase
MRTMRTFCLCAVVFASAGCGRDIVPPEPPPTPDVELRALIARWGVLPILPETPAENPALVALGRSLFFDKILSGNRDVSCATCHDPRTISTVGLWLAGVPGGVYIAGHRAPGAGRQHVPRNAPTLVNVGLGQFYVFWDGRLTQFGPPIGLDVVNAPLEVGNVLVRQAMLPVLTRAEMLGNAGDVDQLGTPNELAVYGDDQAEQIWAAIMRRLLAIPAYVEMFGAAFPGIPVDALRFEHAARAIAAFETHALRRTNTAFDRYLARDNSALSDAAKRGAFIFFGDADCASCHSGPLLGAGNFANVGAPQVGPGVGTAAPLDRGRGELFGDVEFYQFAFRVPPLRNVELTAPYMHSGAYPTLEAVVKHYSDVPKAVRSYDATQLAPSLRSAYHGDAATIDKLLTTLDFRMRRQLLFTEQQQSDLVAFLRSLTDPAARDLSALVPASVPSGLSVER